MKYITKLYIVVLITTVTLSEVRSQKVSDDLVVQLAKPVGKIRGHILQSENGLNFYAFQDVPYAQSTGGKNRFTPPKPLDPWDGIINTTSNQKMCPQPSRYYKYSIKDQIQTEDCLVLNIYTPVKPGSNASLPVFFWIHGGSFVSGSGSIQMYNPKFLIDYDIVIITINYRVGVLGFLTTDDEFLPGNLGYKDQHFALKWANENIHLFGGDPKKITIGGQSAGGMAVGAHLVTPLNQGLIRGVIESSGSGIGTCIYQPNYKEWAFKFGQQLDNSFSSTSSKDLLELLQSVSQEDIINLQHEMNTEELTGFMPARIWKPIFENNSNQDAIVTGHMHENYKKGNFNLVPLFIGFNSEESLAFLRSLNDDQFKEVSKLFDQDVRLLISEMLNIADVEEAANSLKKVYTNASFLADKIALIRYTSDEVFIRSTIRQAQAASNYIPVYLYEFSWDESNGEIPGVPHAADNQYLWRDADSQSYIKELRKPMLKLWTNFIKTLNPTPVEDEDLQNIKWLTVDPNAPVRYLNINKTFEILENPRQFNQIKEVLDKYIQEPYNVY